MLCVTVKAHEATSLFFLVVCKKLVNLVLSWLLIDYCEQL